MLPLKWKIFRVINYVYLVFSLLTIFSVVFGLVNRPQTYANTKDVVIVLTILCPLILATNSIINLSLLASCYPSTYNKKLNTASFVFEILCWLILASFLLGFILGIVEEMGPGSLNDTHDKTGWWLLLFLFLALTSGIYLVWMQIILRKSIHRNSNKSFDNFLQNELN